MSYMHHMRPQAALVAFALSCIWSANTGAQTLDLANLQTVVSGLNAPVGVYFAPGEPSSTLYVEQQGGLIRRSLVNYGVSPPTAATSTFIDLTGRARPGGEQGLLGMAFHPAHAKAGDPNQGTFYVYYNASLLPGMTGSSRTVIARCRRIAANPAAAEFVGEVMTWARPGGNHNGGCIHFGSDGMLYIASGDGGSSGLAQDSRSLMGKLLRIDVTLRPGDDPATFTYRVPSGNPVIPIPSGTTGTPAAEIWACGLRNPWRFSFDGKSGDLYIADVGSGSWEEVDRVEGNGGPGRNYQWPRFEGLHSLLTSTQLAAGTLSTSPVYDYPHSTQAGYPQTMTGSSITGGFVYRGKAIPGWRGRYIFGDYIGSKIWSLRVVNGAAVDVQTHTAQLASFFNPTSFGQDHEGEMYVCFGGSIVRLVAQLPQPSLADVWDSRGYPGPDGFVTGDDFDAFIEFFFNGDDLADVATEGNPDLLAGPDGQVTGVDFDAFVILYFAAS